MKYVSPTIDDLPSLYLQTNDILFNRTNSFELVGKSAIYTGKNNLATFASYLIRIQLVPKAIDPVFVNLAMNSPYFRSTQIEPEVTQQCGQANFNGTKLGSTVLPIPPLAEQKRIVAKVDELMALCDTLEAKLRKASQVQEQLAISSIAALTGIQSQEKETMKAPKTEGVEVEA